MTPEEYLRACGWLPTAVLSDGSTILWSEPLGDRSVTDPSRLHCNTAKAVAIQTARDRARFCFVVERTEDEPDAAEVMRRDGGSVGVGDDWPPPVGAKIRVFYQPNNVNNCLWHVRGHCDGMAVCRRWFRHRQRWHYELLDDTWWSIGRRHYTLEVPP